MENGELLANIISDILFKLGFNNTVMGFYYLVDAIILVNKYNYSCIGEIETVIADSHNTTSYCVEQCMRYCIDKHLRKSLSYTQEFFDYNTKNITTSRLIYKIHYYLYKREKK